jgi:hypothetical protein
MIDNDMECYVWCVVFVDTGKRAAAAAAVERFHREPSYYLRLVDLVRDRKRAVSGGALTTESSISSPPLSSVSG